MFYTIKQKVSKINKLSSSGYSAHSWLNIATNCSTFYEFYKYMRADVDKEREDFCTLVWDVHTGVAFTKLYGALK